MAGTTTFGETDDATTGIRTPASDTGTTDSDADPDRAVFDRCTRWLSFGSAASMRERLRALADRPEADGRPDIYGADGPVPGLERRVADLLGKPRARFLIKGVVAQQAALRAWADRSGRTAVGLHPMSHLAIDEAGALEQLHPLRCIRIGGAGHFTAETLESVGEPLAAVTIELPLRRAGFRLPEWEELVAVSDWCRDHDVPLHIDGARIWEAQPFYGRSLADIAALASSVYVSFYKGLGGLGGCALAAESDFLDATAPWVTRLGGELFATYPYVLSALQGLDDRLPHMADYRDRAVTLAGRLDGIEGVLVEPPQVNAFRVHVRGEVTQLAARHREVADETGAWLFRFAASPLVGYAMSEIQIGDTAAAISDQEVRAALERIVTG
jgi:threonine aldolase